MNALVYRGPWDMRVEEVPDPVIEWPTDALVRITSTNICGSDLHMYEGRTDLKPGTVVGHENLGQVIELGTAVKRIKQGDWVCPPFNVSCGFCRNCESVKTGFCLSMNPGRAGAAYLTACGCLKTGKPSRRTTSCCRTSGPPATTPPNWPMSSPGNRW